MPYIKPFHLTAICRCARARALLKHHRECRSSSCKLLLEEPQLLSFLLFRTVNGFSEAIRVSDDTPFAG